MKSKRYIHFKWAYDYTTKEQIEQLKTILQEKNIPFVFYLSSGFYPHEWVIAKSKYSWDNIMHIVNSIYSAKYDYISSKNEYMTYDNQEQKYVMCYNL